MKQIIIMGATSGIGYETAKIYIRNGWQVGIAGRRKEPLEELKRLSPDRVFTQAIDITSPEAVPGLLSLIKKTGGMDVYLHCSGIGSQNKQLEPETEINTLRTNGEGFTRMVITAFNYFKETGCGHIAVISSIAGTKGIGIAPSYSATKRFQNTYMEALEQLARLQKLNINFTDIRPGFVATPLLKNDKYPMMMQATEVAGQIVKTIYKKDGLKL